MSDLGAPGGESKVVEKIDRLARLASEDLARALNRRSFLKRAGSGAFFFLAALATGQSLANPRRASASAPGPKPQQPDISCSPPGPYCNTGGGNLSGCQGAHCYQHLYNGQIYQCHVYYQYYQAGCWTTASGGTYWTCCDCSCGTPQVTTCGCAQQMSTPAPLPMGPGQVRD